jgi:hypothetical protein
MSQLGWYLRQVRTQTVWLTALTATLPSAMQEEFIKQNKLVPKMSSMLTHKDVCSWLVCLRRLNMKCF